MGGALSSSWRCLKFYSIINVFHNLVLQTRKLKIYKFKYLLPVPNVFEIIFQGLHRIFSVNDHGYNGLRTPRVIHGKSPFLLQHLSLIDIKFSYISTYVVSNE